MRLLVLHVVAIVAVTAGCGPTDQGTEPLSSLPTPESEASTLSRVTFDRSFGEALVGEWESAGCSRDGSDCTIWTFGADGQFTYDFETDDYTDSHSTQWSVEQIAEGVGRVSLEGAGVHLAIIDDQGLSIQDEGTAFVKIASGGGSAAGLGQVDPGPLGHAMIGNWLRQDDLATDNIDLPERITLDDSGGFEASYGVEICAGVWTFGVPGDLGRNAGGSDEGYLRLNSGDLCDNAEGYEERPAWARIDRFSVTSSDELLVLDGVEYRR